jgi:hypothetical protein
MTSSTTLREKSAHGRVFTVEEANATLPLVRAIVSDLVELSRDVIDRRQRLAHFSGKQERKPLNPYEEELAQMEQDVERDGRRLQEYVRELRALGVEPASGSEGLVDFPALLDGRKICLCWQLGEPQVLHWHEVGEGYSQRIPLSAGGRFLSDRRSSGHAVSRN